MSKPKQWKFENLSEQSQKELMDQLRELQIPWNKYQDARKTMTHDRAIQKLRRFRPPTVQEPVAHVRMGESAKLIRKMLKD